MKVYFLWEHDKDRGLFYIKKIIGKLLHNLQTFFEEMQLRHPADLANPLQLPKLKIKKHKITDKNFTLGGKCDWEKDNLIFGGYFNQANNLVQNSNPIYHLPEKVQFIYFEYSYPNYGLQKI